MVDQFCYLGLMFNYNGKFTEVQNILATPGRKACFLHTRHMQNFMLNFETKLSMFDTYVGCILIYASAVWGVCTCGQY